MGEAQQFFAWIRGSFDGIEKDYDRKRTPSIIVVGVTRESMLAYHRALAGRIEWYEERIEKIRKDEGGGLTSPSQRAYSRRGYAEENEGSLDDSGSVDKSPASVASAIHAGAQRATTRLCDYGKRWGWVRALLAYGSSQERSTSTSEEHETRREEKGCS